MQQCHPVCIVCHRLLLTHIDLDEINSPDDIQFSQSSQVTILWRECCVSCNISLVFFNCIFFKTSPQPGVLSVSEISNRVELICSGNQQRGTHLFWRVRTHYSKLQHSWRERLPVKDVVSWGYSKKDYNCIVWGQKCQYCSCNTIKSRPWSLKWTTMNKWSKQSWKKHVNPSKDKGVTIDLITN